MDASRDEIDRLRVQLWRWKIATMLALAISTAALVRAFWRMQVVRAHDFLITDAADHTLGRFGVVNGLPRFTLLQNDRPRLELSCDSQTARLIARDRQGRPRAALVVSDARDSVDFRFLGPERQVTEEVESSPESTRIELRDLQNRPRMRFASDESTRTAAIQIYGTSGQREAELIAADDGPYFTLRDGQDRIRAMFSVNGSGPQLSFFDQREATRLRVDSSGVNPSRLTGARAPRGIRAPAGGESARR
jgi:hypothetical protein